MFVSLSVERLLRELDDCSKESTRHVENDMSEALDTSAVEIAFNVAKKYCTYISAKAT
jgi:hypothetical protein